MCFYNNDRQRGAKVAKEDIPVFKNLYEDDKGIINSPVKTKCKWKIGKLKSSWFMRTWGSPKEIYRGIHSGKTIDAVRGYGGNYYFNAIIPRGSVYWENDEEYVSNKLIITGKI